ncbi:unnamed protein product [Haemonchus placei]|uniref:Galectin n=1 Tax=Haemonchus placei TaxID=6290 RepID=A0A0N4VZD5_HAEPC|nr:unnamed protein product [Haemonchus placei]
MREHFRLPSNGDNELIRVRTDSFVVNLTSGPIVEAEEGGEILDNRLLSIRCDISKNRICFNACVDGEWGK